MIVRLDDRMRPPLSSVPPGRLHEGVFVRCHHPSDQQARSGRPGLPVVHPHAVRLRTICPWEQGENVGRTWENQPQPWPADGTGPNYVTFSAGLVELGAQDEAPAQFFQRCDRALYLARHAGGARTGLG